jgi:hypothetical protein
LSDIALPEIYVMDSFVYNDGTYDYRCVLGRVDCGDRNLVSAIPFQNLAEFEYGTNSFEGASIFYDAATFANTNLSLFKTGAIHTRLTNLFASAQWACLTNPGVTPDLNGFFFSGYNYGKRIDGESMYESGAKNWALAIQDSRGTNVDEMSVLDTRSGGCGAPDGYSGAAAVSISAIAPPGGGVVGIAQPFMVQITNQSSYRSYGTTVSFALSEAFDFGGASGSQGYVSFDSNRIVTYSVGPLLAGDSANIDFQLIPLQANAAPGDSISLSLGLSNSVLAIPVAFPPIQSIPPVLNFAPGPGENVQLDWRADTGLLFAEGSQRLGLGALWSPVNTNNMVTSGANHRFVSQEATGLQGYFRLHSQ